jgi:hypothetical protein
VSGVRLVLRRLRRHLFPAPDQRRIEERPAERNRIKVLLTRRRGV